MKLIPIEERTPMMRCWFCRTNKSVKYTAKMVSVNPLSDRRYMHILVCNMCAVNHAGDFVDDD